MATELFSLSKDPLERIADALDGGGDYNQGKPDEVGYLTRIANYLEENPGGGGSEPSESNVFISRVYYDNDKGLMCWGNTWKELADTMEAGKFIVGLEITEYTRYTYYVLTVSNSVGGSPYISFFKGAGQQTATAQTEDDYPSWED